MANKTRVPMQVSTEFEATIKELQKEIMKKQGVNHSLRSLTEKIAKDIDFKRIEELIKKNRMDINIRLDRREK